MCDRTGCDRPGIWLAGFTFEAVGGSKPVECVSSLRLCTPCRDETKLEDFCTAEWIDGIQKALAARKLMPADPASFKLRFVAAN